MTEQDERKAFEEAAFAQYFLSTITRNKNIPKPKISGCLDLISTADLHQDEFCRRDEQGHYVEEGLEPAWWAWQKAREGGEGTKLAALQGTVEAVANAIDLVLTSMLVPRKVRPGLAGIAQELRDAVTASKKE